MTFTLTLGNVLAALLIMAGGGGTIGAVVALGAFHRWLKPAIREEIVTHEGETVTVEARKAVVRALRAACKVCGLSMDRDANAALNLEHLSSAGSARFQARRDFWLQGSMKREPSSLVSYWA